MVEQRQIPVFGRPGGFPRPEAAGAAASLTPKEVVAILRRHILLMVTLTALGLIFGGAAWFLLLRYDPKYTAYAFLKVLPPGTVDPMTIASPMVQKDVAYGHRATIAALITEQSTLERLIDRPKIRETSWFGQFGDVQEDKQKCIAKAYKDLMRRFGANASRDQEFVIVTMTCGDKKEAALIANEMGELFLSTQGEVKKKDISETLRNLTTQRNSIESNIRLLDDTLDSIRKQWHIEDLSDPERRQFKHPIEVRLDQLQVDYDKLILDIQQVKSYIGTTEKLATGPVTVQIENAIENDPVMVSLAQQLALQEATLKGRLATLGERHRSVQQTQQLIDEIRERRRVRQAEIAEQFRQAQLGNARDQLTVLEQRGKSLKEMLEEVTKKKQDLDLARVQFARTQRVKDERQKTLDEVKVQIEKMNILHDDPESAKVLWAARAVAPLRVSSPRWEFYFSGGTVIGLLLGVGLAFLLELLNDLVRTSKDVGRYLHIPLLGVIPDASEDAHADDVDLYHVVQQAPYSIVSESYRRLRTNMQLSDAGKTLKVLLVGSGGGGEGKSSATVNLGVTLVAENKKVLLMDANFRRPRLQKVFPKTVTESAGLSQSEFGLSSLLMGLCSLEDARRVNVIEGLDIIESGPLPSNPVELLGSYQMQQLMDELRRTYDYVIIDSAPILLVSDAKVLAKLADGTILVFNAGMTRRGAAQRCIMELKDINAVVIGCVLFAVRSLKGGYFREQYKLYQRYQELQPT